MTTEHVTVPRDWLERLQQHHHNPFEPDNQSRWYREITNMLGAAPPSPLMTPEAFEDRMKEIAENGDVESAHANADDLMVELLRSLGFGSGCDVYDNMTKWYA